MSADPKCRVPEPATAFDDEAYPQIALQASNSFVWQFDSLIGCITCSERCKAALGIPTGLTATLSAIAAMIHPEDRNRVLELAKNAACHERSSSAEFRIRRLEGNYQWISVRGGAVNPLGSEPLRLAGIVMQVGDANSDRNQILSQLAHKNQELEAANAELKQANYDLQQFAFSAAHDFREPLRHLSIYSEILQRKPNSALDSEARLCLYFILSSARRIESLIRDLLAYTQVTHDGLSFESVNTDEILSAIVSGMVEDAAIDAEPLPPLQVNDIHLVQLFRHLLENAVKYRRPGVPPKVHVFARYGQDGTVICVEDNGIGIAPEHRTQIFGLFKRLHSAAEYDGTGIGLAICQKIVERYGGRIWVESDGPTGSTFCFTLNSQTELLQARSASSGRC